MLLFQGHTSVVEHPHPRPKPGQRRLAIYESGPQRRPPIANSQAAFPWCLRCKIFSHVLRHCPILRSGQEDRTTDPSTITPSLDEFLFSVQQEFDRDSREEICTRCSDLNIARLFRQPHRPHQTAAGRLLPSFYGEALDAVVEKLGDAKEVELLSSCPPCKLLIASALRLDPAGCQGLQVLRVSAPFLSLVDVPDTDAAVARLLQKLKLENLPKRLFLTSSVGPSSPIYIHPLGIRRGITHFPNCAGSAFPENITPEPQPNWPVVQGWIHDCETSHKACQLQPTDNLHSKIRVVDAIQRMVITYNNIQERHDYVALSYVWGGSRQPTVALNVPFSARMPQTIEDAMEVTRRLGKRYLWVDGLCIDQNDEEHKREQIAMMDRIYRAAWATIINLSGTSAESSIPRVSGDFHIPQAIWHAADGDRFVSTPPALAAYIRQSPWSSRAWVLQEAILSRRRIFFTGSQVYFECNSRQDSEFDTLERRSLSETQQKACIAAEELAACHFSLDFGNIETRGPINCQNRRTNMYASLLSNYRGRHMTFSSDSLNAFAGIAAALSSGFNTCFVWGMPAADFPYVLGWRQAVLSDQLPEFPSWAWVSREGPLSRAVATPYAYEDWQLADDGRPFFEPFFKLHGFDCERDLEDDESHRPPWESASVDVPLLKVKSLPYVDAVQGLGEMVLASSGNLVVEGIVLTLFANGKLSVSSPMAKYPMARIAVALGSTTGTLKMASGPHAEFLRQAVGDDAVEALVLGRGELLSSVSYELLLLEWRNGVAYRLDCVSLEVPGKELAQIVSAKPTRKKFVLG